MNKELKALEKLMNGCCDTCTMAICEIRRNGACPNFRNYKIIETALKEKKNIEKSISELFSGKNGEVITSIDIKKKLKALEIIKRHLDCSIFIKQLSQYYEKETIDLLKEVLL